MRRIKTKLLLFLPLLFVIPVVFLRDYTPSNELRYLQIVDEALQNGTFFSFTCQGEAYADKPPLYFWLLMIANRLVGGHSMAAYALASLLPALGTILLIDRWRKDWHTSRGNDGGQSVMLWSTAFFIGSALVLRPDMLMTFFIVSALYVFYRRDEALRSGSDLRGGGLLFGLLVFLALFSKGPFGVLIPLSATLVYLIVEQRVNSFFRLWNAATWAVLFGGCALWWTATYLEAGGDYLYNLLFHQTVDRAVQSFTHTRPFYYYLLTIGYIIAPWTLLAVVSWVKAIRDRALQDDRLARYFLTIVATTFVMLSCVSSKVDVYLLPILPFLIALTAHWWPRYGESRWVKCSLALPAVIYTAAFPSLYVWSMVGDCPYATPWSLTAAGVMTLIGVVSLVLVFKKQRPQLAVTAIGLGLFLAAFIGGWDLPCLNGRIGYGEIAKVAKQTAEREGLERIYTIDLSRPENISVYVNRKVRRLTDEELKSDTLAPGVLIYKTSKMQSLPAQYQKVSKEVPPYAVAVIPFALSSK